MDTASIALGILPLFAFVVVDSFLGIKAALITTVALAILETIFSIYFFGDIDIVTISSLLLVFALAIYSWRTKKDIYIKLQPVFLSFAFSVILIVSFLVEQPILLKMMIKYAHLMPENIQLNLENDVIQMTLSLNTLTLGISLFLHGLVTLYAALKLNNWWWIAIRGISFYVFMLISMIATRILI